MASAKVKIPGTLAVFLKDHIRRGAHRSSILLELAYDLLNNKYMTAELLHLDGNRPAVHRLPCDFTTPSFIMHGETDGMAPSF